MSFSDVSAVVNHFATANEGFSTTTNGQVLSSANTVGLNSVAGLTNGSVFVGVIEPAGTKEQVFTGTVDTAGSQITGVIWTKGTNVTHSTGVSVVDYDTGTAFNMMRKGISVSLDQDGTLKAGAVDNATVLANNVVTAPKISGLDKSNLTTDSNPYKFHAYKTTAQNVGTGDTKILFNAEAFDTNSSFDSATNFRYTAPVAGFYFFSANVMVTTTGSGTSLVINLYKNGAKAAGVPCGVRQDVTSGLAPGVQISGLVQLAAGDYVEVFVGTGAAAKALDVNESGNNTFSGFLVSRT